MNNVIYIFIEPKYIFDDLCKCILIVIYRVIFNNVYNAWDNHIP